MHSPREEWFRYQASTTTTIGNTTDELSQFPNGVGSRVFQPEDMKAGKCIRIRIRGYVSASSTSNTTIRVKLGSNLILEHTGTLASGLDEAATDFDAELRLCDVGPAGHVCLNGMTRTCGKHGVGPISGRSLSAINVPADLSGSCELDVTYQWDHAAEGNVLVLTHASVEVCA